MKFSSWYLTRNTTTR